MTQEADGSISPAKTMTWSMRFRRRWTTFVPARRGPPSGVVKTHPALEKIKVRGAVGRPRTRPDAVAANKGVLLASQPRLPA